MEIADLLTRLADYAADTGGVLGDLATADLVRLLEVARLLVEATECEIACRIEDGESEISLLKELLAIE